MTVPFLLSLLGTLVLLVVIHTLIRSAVSQGVYDAHRRLERDRVRAAAGVSEERSPNSTT